MKIAILTLPLHTNYGGILQAYALQTVLEKMGHEVCLIEKRRKPLRLPLWKAPLSYGKRIVKNLTGHPFPIFYEQKINREEPIIRQNTDKFINKYIKRRIVDDYSDIQEKDFDAFVVGSDQVWRPKYFHEIEHAFLDFTEGWNVKRVAYAASFGTDAWEYTPKQTKRCRELIKNFDAVSVRESSGVYLCRKYLGVDAAHVLDPTMLLSIDDYYNLGESANIHNNKEILFNYILDETSDKRDLIHRISAEKGLTPFHICINRDFNVPVKKRIQPPLKQWLRGFIDAKFVVTDSFHACVFSIIFHKPFLAVGNSNRGLSRFTNLLNLFGLGDRLLVKSNIGSENNDINWTNVDNILLNYKEKSHLFLTKIFQ